MNTEFAGFLLVGNKWQGEAAKSTKMPLFLAPNWHQMERFGRVIPAARPHSPAIPAAIEVIGCGWRSALAFRHCHT
jgi:hypothetical protein